MNLDKFKQRYALDKDNPVALSDLAVELASELFTHSTKVAESELLETQEVVGLLKAIADPETKKPSVAESEKRAVVNTANVYGRDKANLEAGYEYLNAIKTRIKTLLNERENI